MPKPDPSGLGGIGKYLGSAIILPIATIVGYVMGYGIDALFHTTWIRYVFLVLGAIAGFVEAIRVLTKET